MSGEDLAKAFESVVLRVLEQNPVALTNALRISLDGEMEGGVELVKSLQKKMNITSATPSMDNSLNSTADSRIYLLREDLDNCGSAARSRFIDLLVDMGFATEDHVDNAVSERMSEYCDEDQVKDLINGAWNGA